MEWLSFSEILTPTFLSALMAIILIDLALAGDNAIVIALAARQVPLHMQRKVLIWGSVAAVVVRGVASIFVVWLLKIPGFLLAGGALLLYIAYKLVDMVIGLRVKEDEEREGLDISSHGESAYES